MNEVVLFRYAPRCLRLSMRWVLLLLFCTVLSAVEERTVPIPPTPLVLAVPGDWSLSNLEGGALAVVRSPLPEPQKTDEPKQTEKQGSISIVIEEKLEEGPLAFAVRCRRDLERTMTGLALDKSEEMVLGGRSWIKQPYTFKVGQFTWRQEFYATVIDGTGVAIVCSARDDAFTDWKAIFATAIESLGRSRLQIESP